MKEKRKKTATWARGERAIALRSSTCTTSSSETTATPARGSIDDNNDNSLRQPLMVKNRRGGIHSGWTHKGRRWRCVCRMTASTKQHLDDHHQPQKKTHFPSGPCAKSRKQRKTCAPAQMTHTRVRANTREAALRASACCPKFRMWKVYKSSISWQNKRDRFLISINQDQKRFKSFHHPANCHSNSHTYTHNRKILKILCWPITNVCKIVDKPERKGSFMCCI